MFDPQTSGGLILCLPENEVNELLNKMIDNGVTASIVGEINNQSEKVEIFINMNYLLTFLNTHAALKAEKKLKNLEIKIDLIPTPREISAECGFSILIDLNSDNVVTYLKDNNLKYGNLFKITNNNGEKVMKKLINAIGLECPKPVIKTKEALENIDFTELEILVDNEAAKENVSRFINKFGFEVEKVDNEGSNYHIHVKVGDQKQRENENINIDDFNCNIPVNNSKTVFIGNDRIGHGNEDLGKLLIKGFLYTLTELKNRPQTIIFMNAGVTLCCEGSSSLENLQKLNDLGVEILACGTCLDYYGMKDKLRVGNISNMYDIAENMLNAGDVLRI